MRSKEVNVVRTSTEFERLNNERIKELFKQMERLARQERERRTHQSASTAAHG